MPAPKMKTLTTTIYAYGRILDLYRCYYLLAYSSLRAYSAFIRTENRSGSVNPWVGFIMGYKKPTNCILWCVRKETIAIDKDNNKRF